MFCYTADAYRAHLLFKEGTDRRVEITSAMKSEIKNIIEEKTDIIRKGTYPVPIEGHEEEVTN